MTDRPDPSLLPPELHLADGDVVEAVEEVEDVVDPLASAEVEPRTSGFDGVGTRREARERALALLYEADQKELRPLALVLDDLPLPPVDFARDLVLGVSEHLEAIDALLARCSHRWPLERMPAIDRTLLRMASYELGHTDVPVGACISEAVELAKRYSTDDSGAFVNGLLARVADELRSEG